MVYQALYNNIIDNIKEAHMKLGFTDSEVSLNYQIRSLGHLVDEVPATEALEVLVREAQPTLGQLTYRIRDNVVRITVPREGVRYVRDHVPERPLLRELISLVQTPTVTLEEILTMFRRHSDNVACEPTEEGGMDYVIWFPDGDPDDYRYCLCLDGLGATYHRLSKADFEDIYKKDEETR